LFQKLGFKSKVGQICLNEQESLSGKFLLKISIKGHFCSS